MGYNHMELLEADKMREENTARRQTLKLLQPASV